MVGKERAILRKECGMLQSMKPRVMKGRIKEKTCLRKKEINCESRCRHGLFKSSWRPVNIAGCSKCVTFQTAAGAMEPTEDVAVGSDHCGGPGWALQRRRSN